MNSSRRFLLVCVAVMLLGSIVTPSSAREFSTSGAWSVSSLPGRETNKNSIYTRDLNALAIWSPQLHSDGPTRFYRVNMGL